MDEQELKDIFDLLEKQGWKPMLCDTPVPFYDCGVSAGIPQGIGEYGGDNIMLPRELVGYEPMVLIRVRGNSLCR